MLVKCGRNRGVATLKYICYNGSNGFALVYTTDRLQQPQVFVGYFARHLCSFFGAPASTSFLWFPLYSNARQCQALFDKYIKVFLETYNERHA